MTMFAETNGKWPDLSIEETDIFIPEDATDKERSSIYATAILKLVSLLPKIVHALEFLRDAGHQATFEAIAAREAALSAKVEAVEARVAAKSILRRINDRADHIDELLDEIPQPIGAIPPMRQRFDSSHDHAEDAARQAGAEASKSPNVNSSPDEVAAMIQPAIERALRDQKATENQKRLDDLAAADNEAKIEAKRIKDRAAEDARKLKMRFYLILLGLFSAAGMALIGVMANNAKERAAERAAGHADGIAELRSIVDVQSAVLAAPAYSAAVELAVPVPVPSAGASTPKAKAH